MNMNVIFPAFFNHSVSWVQLWNNIQFQYFFKKNQVLKYNFTIDCLQSTQPQCMLKHDIFIQMF